MIGDAGEHYALSHFTFRGKPATKMPDGWTGYDLAVESGKGLQRISVKTRRETVNWKAASWFVFDERLDCDWLVFIFLTSTGAVRAWVLPFSVATAFANKPRPTRKAPHLRDISFAKLTREPLSRYEDNWHLLP